MPFLVRGRMGLLHPLLFVRGDEWRGGGLNKLRSRSHREDGLRYRQGSIRTGEDRRDHVFLGMLFRPHCFTNNQVTVCTGEDSLSGMSVKVDFKH